MHIDIQGQGPWLVLVHGSATDADTWLIQRTALRRSYRLLTYDRRGTPRSPLPASATSWSVARHADDLAELLMARASEPVLVCGSSFGAVCVLELAQRRPELLRGVILCEPPLSIGTRHVAVESFRVAFERVRREQGGERAAEFFLRSVLGTVYDDLPATTRQRCLGLRDQIALDVEALSAYIVDMAALARIEVPVLLLGGERSLPTFRPVLETLAATLPRAELRILPGASHMMYADAARAFHDELERFARKLGHIPAPRP